MKNRFPKYVPGRKGYPAEYVAAMYADYQGGMSLAQVGKKYDRTRQAVFDLFKARKLPLRTREFQPALVHNGRKYTPSKNGYLRDTIFRGRYRGSGEKQLHRAIWESLHGPIPPRFNVHFKNGNKLDFRPDNLECAPVAVISSRTATGENQFTKSARERMQMLLRSANGEQKLLARRLK